MPDRVGCVGLVHLARVEGDWRAVEELLVCHAGKGLLRGCPFPAVGAVAGPALMMGSMELERPSKSSLGLEYRLQGCEQRPDM